MKIIAAASRVLLLVPTLILRIPVFIYRYGVSPFRPAACRHVPSCSEYADEAVKLNGAWKGGWLALSRILRCHPWGSQGLDPVPDIRAEQHRLAPWRYGRWNGNHIEQSFVEKDDANAGSS